MSLASNDAPHADLSNWRTAPHSAWAFRNVSAIVPTAAIDSAPDDVWALPAAPRAFDGFKLDFANGSSLDFAGFLQATASDGLVVLHEGRIVHESYHNGAAPHAPHILMSATKSVTGLVVGVLAGRGGLDVDALVTDYVPEVADGPYRGATIRHLLDMRAGVVLDEGQQRAYAAATGWDPTPPGEATDLHTFFAAMAGPPATHGGPFRYVSANTDLLGWAIERAAGRPFASLAGEVLWKPMGAEDGAYITTDSKGAPRCTGGLCATVRDFARLGQLVLQGGRRGGAEIVPSSWIDDMAANGDRDAWRKGDFAAGFGGLPMFYRSGWYVIDAQPKILFAMGIHGQNLFVDRANSIVIAKVSSQNDPIDYPAIGLTHRAVAEIRRCLLAAA